MCIISVLYALFNIRRCLYYMSRRMNITFNDKAYDILEELQKKTGKTKSDLLRNALALLDYTQENKDKGKKLFIADENDTLEKEIVLP